MGHNVQPNLAIIIGILIVPFPSIQHFIWPLSWCLLADFCNHTWIPECGFDELENNYRLFIDECDMFEYNCDHEKDFDVTNYSNCFRYMKCPTAIPCPSKPSCPDHRFHRMGDRYVFVKPRTSVYQSAPKSTTSIQETQTVRVKIRRRFHTPQDIINNYKRRSERTRRVSMGSSRRTRPKGHPTRHTTQIRRIFEPTTSLHSFHHAFSIDQTAKNTRTLQKKHEPTRGRINRTKFKLQTIILKRETVLRFGKKIMRVVKDYELANYSDCFRVGGQCPTQAPCPSNPTCPNHKFHRMGDHYVFMSPRRQGRRMAGLSHTLPVKMMKGKRRYTPEVKKRRDRARLATKTTTPRTRRKNHPIKPTENVNKHTKRTVDKEIETSTVILKRQSVQLNGKKFIRVVKGIVRQLGMPLKIVEELERKDKSDSDFLE